MVIEHFRDGGEGIRCAGGVADDVHGLRIVRLLVHAEAEGSIGGILAGGGDDDFLRASFEVESRLVALGEASRAFEDHIHLQFFVGKLKGVFAGGRTNRAVLGCCKHSVSVAGARAFGEPCRTTVETAVGGVEFEEMREGFTVGEVIDEDDVKAFDAAKEDIVPCT